VNLPDLEEWKSQCIRSSFLEGLPAESSLSKAHSNYLNLLPSNVNKGEKEFVGSSNAQGQDLHAKF
jgi:hypothetical protein